MMWRRAGLERITDSPTWSVDVMTRKDKAVYWLWVCIWIGVNASLWTWWLRKEHVTSLVLFVVATLALLYEFTVLPTFYLFYLGRMRRPKEVKPEPGLRVAMVTAIVPSRESIEVLIQTLRGMRRVTYAHDNWLLDEGDDPAVKSLCRQLRVKYFCRKRVPRYNQDSYPFKARTKAGNYNAWLDAVGYRHYDIVVQLDTDHVPRPDYLDEVLGHLRDRKVAWVQAPSVYGNFEHWTALGSTEQELVLQGPLQMGFYGFCHTPFIIGSHTAFRVKALQEIGGFSETRAEDHLNTVKLASHGYKGVFVPKHIATGLGPEDFDTYLSQQFAWAYSMIQIMLHYAPMYARRYSRRQRLQFLFVQTWYALWGTTYGVLLVLPMLALVLNVPIASIPFLPFMARYLPVLAVSFAIFWWSRKWFHPRGHFLSWRAIILQAARWPIVLGALIHAVLGIQHPYMITPKGVHRGERRPFRLQGHLPYLLACAAALGASLHFLRVTLRQGPSSAQGYLIYTVQGLVTMLGVYLVVLLLDIRALRREGVRLLRSLALRLKPILISSFLALASLVIVLEAAGPIAMAITWTTPPGRHERTLAAWARLPSVGVPSATVSTPVQVEIVSSATSTHVQTAKPTPTPVPSTPTPTSIPIVGLPKQGVVLGAYDPGGMLSPVEIGIEHRFISWRYSDHLGEIIGEIRSRRRLPMITVEPHPLGTNGPTRASLFAEIADGGYDQVIMTLAQIVFEHAPQRILVRWGHEMELMGLYPWSQEDSGGYIAAYRHVVDLFREIGVDNVAWIWSPAGNPGTKRFYPGDQYVDFIGITILSDEGWDRHFGFDHARSFSELMSDKYYLAEEFGKPLIIAEAGVSGSDARQAEWLRGAFASFDHYPRLWGFVYYNDQNRPNPIADTTPDWRTTHDTFEEALGIGPMGRPLVPGAPGSERQGTGSVIHIVQWGENLALIARRYGITVAAIVQANGLVNPDYTYAGQRLVIPSRSSLSVLPAGQTTTAE